MTKQYTATRGFPYKTRHLVAGEAFEADEKLGTLLVKMGKARESAPTPAAGPAAAPAPAPALPVVVVEPVKAEPEPAPVLAETVVAEPARDLLPAGTPGVVVSTSDEPAKPAFKTRRTYGSKAP